MFKLNRHSVLGIAGVLMTTMSVGALLAAQGGIISAAVVARGAFQQPVDIKIKVDQGSEDVLHVSHAQDTIMQQIVLAPGGFTGWHSHPGPAIALVKAGTLTVYSAEDAGCEPVTYAAGQAFVDPGQGHVHNAYNLSATDNAEVWVTYLDVPPDAAGPRIPQPAPGNCAALEE